MNTIMENTLFYPIFIAQILLVSWYFPKLIIQRTDWVLKHCPESDYPKLYPVSVEHFKSKQQLYVRANAILIAMGVVAILWIAFTYWGSTEAIHPMLPWGYFMLQMMPIVLAEVLGFKFFKLMREANTNRIRKATLQPRRLFDYVSPKLVAGAVLVNLAMVTYTLAIFDFSLAISDVPVASVIILLLGNGFFAGIIRFNVYGKKQDPYQDGKDRTTEVKTVVQTLLFMSIFMSFFMAAIASSNRFELDLVTAVFMSLFCQAVALIAPGLQLHSLKLEQIDFDVYKGQENPID